MMTAAEFRTTKNRLLSGKFRIQGQKSGGLLKNFRTWAQILKSRGHKNRGIFEEFLVHIFRDFCIMLCFRHLRKAVVVLPWSGGDVGGRLVCRKALTGLQRGPRCVATGPPLQCREHAVVTQRGPYGKTRGALLLFFGHQKVVKF